MNPLPLASPRPSERSLPAEPARPAPPRSPAPARAPGPIRWPPDAAAAAAAANAGAPAAGWRRWPLPALGAWALAWLAFAGARAAGLDPRAAAVAAALLGVGLARLAPSRMRAALVAAGFPLSLLVSGAAPALPAWAWLLPLAALLLLYPARAWRDAPLFPTPAGALDALPQCLALADGARLLDAGCGLGHGLHALHRAWPRARIEGIESSLPLALWARRRCRFARVHRGDLWVPSWAPYALVYLFQRPESMAPALAKARAEMAPGSWLVSLAFAVPGVCADAVLHCPDGRPLWLYRAGPAVSSPAPRRR